MFNLTPAAKNILIINVIIFFLTSNYIIEEFGLRYLLSENFKPYQILSYMWQFMNYNGIGCSMLLLLLKEF